MSDLDPWLPTLEPPAGGYRRLAAALDGRRRAQAARRARGRWMLAGASLAIAALALAPLWPRQDARFSAALAASLQQGWEQGGRELTVVDGAALQLARQPGLRVYWIEVDPAKASPSSTSPSPSR